MRRFLLPFIFIITPVVLFSQSIDYNDIKNWDDICYCSTNNSFHPHNVVNADNNWQLLLAMKNGLTLTELDSTKIPYTQSQLMLLRSQRLLERTQNRYKTSIPVLDKEQTSALRTQSLSVAKSIYPGIERECKDLVTYLSKQNRAHNAFSILFSYVLDGLIWERFENEGMIEKRDGSEVWSGSYWFMTPKRSFGCGTNSITEGGCTLHINWAEQSNVLMKGFYNLDFKGLLKPVEQHSKSTDKKIAGEFSPFGFFDENANLTIPIIDENDNNDLYSLSNKVIDKIFPVFVKYVDIEAAKESYQFKDSSETVIILYHEVMWDILNLLLENRIVQMPVAFETPEKATAIDVADLCFFTIDKRK